MNVTVNRTRITAPKEQGVQTALFAAVFAFLTYASVYAFRKPFTVAKFEGLVYWHISYQTLLIISQVIGYMLSKFSGIRFIAEMKRFGRWKAALLLVLLAWLCLFFLAVVPAPYGMFFLFLNGYFLGFLWGIVFSYVEGRRSTDFIGAVMAVSFIFAGGFTRSVAIWLMEQTRVSEYWMPFITGLIFILPFTAFLLMMERIPPPSPEDMASRSPRTVMDRPARRSFIREFRIGLILVVVIYVLLTIMRDVRDNYMANMWRELGYQHGGSVYTNTESITSLLVLSIMAMLVIIRNNIRALRIVHFVIVAGLIIAGGSSLLFMKGWINGYWWMQGTGTGLYLCYIPFNCIFFERLIAAFRIKGNTGFLMYFADAFGYLGSVVVMLVREFISLKISWVGFYTHGVLIFTVVGIVATILSMLYFGNQYRKIILTIHEA